MKNKKLLARSVVLGLLCASVFGTSAWAETVVLDIDDGTTPLTYTNTAYNIFDNGIDILSALINSKCLELPSNRDSNYIYLLLGQQLSTIKSARHYSVRNKLSFYMNAINNFLIIPSMSVKEKVITCLRKDLYNIIINNYKEELNRLNITLKFETNDENGETNNSSSEVEGA